MRCVRFGARAAPVGQESKSIHEDVTGGEEQEAGKALEHRLEERHHVRDRGGFGLWQGESRNCYLESSLDRARF